MKKLYLIQIKCGLPLCADVEYHTDSSLEDIEKNLLELDFYKDTDYVYIKEDLDLRIFISEVEPQGIKDILELEEISTTK